MEEVTVLRVPGALELPVAALALARSGCHGVVAVGTVIKGDTDHYDVVVNESAAGLTAASLDTGIPVTNAVLAVHEAAHARERSLPGAGNKGFEAATAAVSMAAAFARARGRFAPMTGRPVYWSGQISEAEAAVSHPAITDEPRFQDKRRSIGCHFSHEWQQAPVCCLLHSTKEEGASQSHA